MQRVQRYWGKGKQFLPLSQDSVHIFQLVTLLVSSFNLWSSGHLLYIGCPFICIILVFVSLNKYLHSWALMNTRHPCSPAIYTYSCSWQVVHNFSITYSWLFYDLPITFSWLFHDSFKTCSWLVACSMLFTTYSWIVHSFSITCPLF